MLGGLEYLEGLWNLEIAHWFEIVSDQDSVICLNTSTYEDEGRSRLFSSITSGVDSITGIFSPTTNPPIEIV